MYVPSDPDERRRDVDRRPDGEWDHDPEPERTPREPEPPRTRRARLLLAGVALALFAAMLVADALSAAGLEQTSLFYVGIPAVIALAVILTARPKSPVGVALATTTVGLALAGPLLDEGIVCLVVAAPLFYGVAAAVGLLVQQARNRRRGALVIAPLLLVALVEGVGGASLVSRDDAGTATTVVEAPAAAFADALAAEPTYGEPESVLLSSLPFPQPVAATGSGLDVGDERHVTFSPRRSLGLASQPTPRSMSLRVAESAVSDDGGRVVFDITADSTLARWMDLRSAEVVWTAADDGTRVTWTLRYRRTFDPSWYFGPVQRYATDQAAGYLLDTFGAAVEGR